MHRACRALHSGFLPHLRHTSTLLSPFPPSVSNHLLNHGYAVFPSALSAPTTAALRAEIDSLFAAGHLQTNATHIVSSSSTTTFPKRNVLEAELSQLPPALLSSLPTLSALVQDPSIPALLSVHAPRFTLLSQALKIQRAQGDAACFPVHVDSSPSVDRRVVTALLYLNDGWHHQHGGQLRLYNSPTTTVDIQPTESRLVLLAATGMHHRVLPSFSPRYVITMWISGTVRNSPSMTSHARTTEELAALKLLEPKFKDMAFRLLLVDEWERSLWEAHPHDIAKDAVQMHRSNLAIIRDRLPAALRRELGDEHQLDKLQDLVRQPQYLLDIFRDLEGRDSKFLSFQW